MPFVARRAGESSAGEACGEEKARPFTRLHARASPRTVLPQPPLHARHLTYAGRVAVARSKQPRRLIHTGAKTGCKRRWGPGTNDVGVRASWRCWDEKFSPMCERAARHTSWSLGNRRVGTCAFGRQEGA